MWSRFDARAARASPKDYRGEKDSWLNTNG